ncbi:MAG: hypothetical protein DMG84_06140 [Acidobacteria bacterium]|nr:MAG: hypothetical protein DMG84_06140 [Acidobacteriota bacterium]
MVLPSLVLESIKNQKLYLLFLQSSAARPQAYEPASLQTGDNRRCENRIRHGFARIGFEK